MAPDRQPGTRATGPSCATCPIVQWLGHDGYEVLEASSWPTRKGHPVFGEINGLPVHPLAVHAAVVLVPLAALLGVLFAVPRTRAWSRVPLLLVSLGAVVAVYVARQSGAKLQEALGLQDGGADNPVAKLVEEHQERAQLLFILVLAFAAIAIVAVVLSRNTTSFDGPLAIVLSALLVLGALGVAFQTYRVGDIGSKAVWNPTGVTDYSGTGDG